MRFRSRRSIALLAAAGAALAAGLANASSPTGPSVTDALSSYLSTHLVGESAEAEAAALNAATPPATPKATCGPGSNPETAAQGRVPLIDYRNGRAAKGYTCNAEQISHSGSSGGFKTFRYVDTAGHICAIYDGSNLAGTTPVHQGDPGGVHILDMSQPAQPVLTARLVTPAMLSPHESLSLNAKRGLLAAGLGTPAVGPGVIELYDLSKDCRHPVLQTSMPFAGFGHESGFSPDGKTFIITSATQLGVTAFDVIDPKKPKQIWQSFSYSFHGLNFNSSGTRLYAADLGRSGLTILDINQIQNRMFYPDPKVSQVSFTTWPTVSIPQNSVPVTIKGKKYLIEFDEYSNIKSQTGLYTASAKVGAGRLINIDDEKKPKVVSNLRLEVNQPEARRGSQQQDPGAKYPVQGYAAHYCAVPRAVDPTIVACSFILSGLRVFNIADPLHPREVAYFNKPAPNTLPLISGSFAMSAPTFDVKNHAIWYADSDSGFYAVKLTNGAWPKGV